MMYLTDFLEKNTQTQCEGYAEVTIFRSIFIVDDFSVTWQGGSFV